MCAEDGPNAENILAIDLLDNYTRKHSLSFFMITYHPSPTFFSPFPLLQSTYPTYVQLCSLFFIAVLSLPDLDRALISSWRLIYLGNHKYNSAGLQ